MSRHTEITGQNKDSEDDVKHRRELYSRVKSYAKTASRTIPFSIYRARNCNNVLELGKGKKAKKNGVYF